MRKALAFVTALAAVGLTAGPVSAEQCPLLLKQIDDGVAHRLVAYGDAPDPIAPAAQTLAAEGMKAHEAGNHAEAMAKLKQAAGLMWGSPPRLDIKQ